MATYHVDGNAGNDLGDGSSNNPGKAGQSPFGR